MTNEELRIKMKELWKERIYLSIECYTTIGNSEFEIINTIKKLNKNSEDIGELIGITFKNECIKNQDHKEYYKNLLKKSHPLINTKLTDDETKWMIDYTAGIMITTMLKNNTTIIKNVFMDRHNGDLQKALVDEEALTENGVSISAQLSSLNKYWKVDEIKELLLNYNRILIDMAISHYDKSLDSEHQDFMRNSLNENGMKIAGFIVDGLEKVT